MTWDTEDGVIDVATVRRALERLRRIAYQRRYGGLWADYVLARKALMALEQMQQPPLFAAAEVEAAG